MYEEIPHLLTPVVVDPKQAANALRVGRARDGGALQDAGGRGRAQHRPVQPQHPAGARAEARAGGRRGAPKPLPYIVVVIDELADLMMVASSEVEESIARLAQMARAVGIHLILATQRPSVDVITGLIKANLPARISFRLIVEGRLAHDPRRQRRRAAARPRRHAVPAAGLVAADPAARARTSPSRRARGWPRSSASRASRSTTRRSRPRRRAPTAIDVREGRPVRRGGAHRRASPARRRSRICSAACASGSAGRPGSWT